MNTRYFSLLALLVLPSALSFAMDKPTAPTNSAEAPQIKVPDLKTIINTLSRAIKSGNEAEIAQCISNAAYHENSATQLFPVMQEIMNGKTALSARDKSWTLASFAFAFYGTPYYDQICRAITRFRTDSEQLTPAKQEPTRKDPRLTLEERIDRAMQARNTSALLELLDQCETIVQRERIGAALNTLM